MLNIGDRMQSTHVGVVFEITGVIDTNDDYPCICIEVGTSGWKIGMTTQFGFVTKANWTYLGNFNKSKNFNSLYDLLNS